MTRTPGRLAPAVLAAGLVALAPSVAAQPAGTAFTYQGRLTDAGNPASGSYDLQVALFDAASGGAQVGPTLTRDDVVVANGLFTVTLDFGPVFTGSKRWLELGVRPGASTGGYTTLAGRQEMTPTPHAAFSAAAPWTGVTGKPPGFADDTDNDALGGLSCANGQVAKRVAGNWACADDLDSGGDITAVTAGTGLTGGGASGAVTIGASLAGSGSATTLSRSDHDHFSQSWSGANANGLTIDNSGGVAVRGVSAVAASGAIVGANQSPDGIGVYGQAAATSGVAVGVRGDTISPIGIGVMGYANSSAGTGSSIGVQGQAVSSVGVGVWGFVWSPTGATVGVRGTSLSDAGTGVLGTATAAGGATYGVLGEASSPQGLGVHGRNTAADGHGLQGSAAAPTGSGVGVRAITNGPSGAGVFATAQGTAGQNYGVRGESSSPQGTGLHGQAWATSGFANGVWGRSFSSDGNGVVGQAAATTGPAWGVFGSSSSSQGVGVYGLATPTSGGVGVYGFTLSSTGFGGVFENAGGGPAIAVSSGGIIFSDGTTQTTAAVSGSGDVTAVLTPAGSGLTGGSSSGDVTLGVSFGGSGVSAAVSRSDHNHSGQTWSGDFSGSAAFRVINSGGGFGFTDGAWGQSGAAGGARGVVGYATAASGANYGVWGQADSPDGLAVYGVATAGSGTATGVQGDTSSPSGRGVYGHATSLASGSTYGVYGKSEAANDGRGVGGSGVFGVFGTGSRSGTYGTDTNAAFNGAGIWGQSVSTDNGAGVFGQALASTGVNYGVYASTSSAAGYAGFFLGRVHVTGTLSKGGGAFKIDHPLDPERKYLYHSFVESPDMMNIYNGNVVTDGEGFATIELPGWFEALNRDFRYQLTVIGRFAQAIVAKEIEDNRFTIQTSVPDVKVSWQVTGVRHDAFAEKHRIPVEEDKSPEEQGTYLHPEEHGRPREQGVEYRRGPVREGALAAAEGPAR